MDGTDVEKILDVEQADRLAVVVHHRQLVDLPLTEQTQAARHEFVRTDGDGVGGHDLVDGPVHVVSVARLVPQTW